MSEDTPKDITPVEQTLPETAKVGRRHIMPVFLPATPEQKAKGLKARLVSFTEQETMVLKSFLRTRSYQETGKELEIKPDSVRRILARPNLKSFLADLASRAAIAESTDLNLVMREMRLIYEGEVKVDDHQMTALKEMGKILTPRGPGVVIQNNQTNVYADAGDNDWRDARAAASD